ncbi:MarC family protein [Fusobacterium sp.]|uniref:MarC family protein n=1 Tax=Fusobacterium sp. TaxID=68766 RepID=UPI00396C545F
MNLTVIFTNALTLIAVLNPFGNVPLFIGMSDGMDKKIRTRLQNTIILTAFAITFIFSLVGEFLMTKFYKIGMDELKMAGGLILIVIATKNLIFPEMKNNLEENMTPDQQVKKAIIPLAFPILVGPGVLTTALINRSQTGTVVNSISIGLAFIIIYGIYIAGGYLEKILGKLVLFILSRVMQIFILAIGFRILFSGLSEAIKLYNL